MKKYWWIKYAFISLVLCLVSCKKDSEEFIPPPPPNAITVEDVQHPRIEINTNGLGIPDEPKILADMVVMDLDDSGQLIEDYKGKIGIELRGSSSQSLFNKKSYGVETWAEDGSDIDVSIFGFPEEEDWILNGPYSDKSLIRNVLMFDLARDMGRYSSRTKICELFINGAYRGVYVFMEKLKRNENRIDISKLRPDENTGEDVTGGYILKIDKATGSGNGSTDYNNNNSFPSAYNVAGNLSSEINTYFQYEYPDENDITNPQKNYIKSYISDFEDALVNVDYSDTVLGYRAYIDVPSFVDYFILNEVSHNVDGYRLSTFLFKDKNDKINLGPIWDFNIALGNVDFCQGGEPNNWMFNFNDYCPWDTWLIPFWWDRLLDDPYFVAQIKERYESLRLDVLSTAQINMKIDVLSSTMISNGSIDRNFQQWPVLGGYVWPNRFVGNNYSQEINYLKDWLGSRLEWMDERVPSL